MSEKNNPVSAIKANKPAVSEVFASLSKIDCGNRAKDFQREILVSLLFVMIAASIGRFALEIWNENYINALTAIGTTLLLVPCLHLAMQNRYVEQTAILMGLMTLAGFLMMAFMDGYQGLTAYAAAPACIALCTIFLRGAMIYIAGIVIAGVILFKLFGFHSVDTTPISALSNEQLKGTYAAFSLATLSIVFYAFLKFKKAHEKAVLSLGEEQQKIQQVNEELTNLVVRQQLKTKMQIKLQHVGKMTGWWIDVKKREIAISAKIASGEFAVLNATLSEDYEFQKEDLEKLSAIKQILFWREKINPLLKLAVTEGVPWDLEYEDASQLDSPRWFRSVGEVESDENGVAYIFGVIHDITANKALTQRLEHQANFDELTGLHNRRSFDGALTTALEDKDNQGYFYLFIDLDRFKIVNDTSGHVAGDELLKVVTGIVENNLRKSDIAGRLGGDEFGILLAGCDQENALRIAQRIRLEIEELVFSWEKDCHRIGATIGAVEIGAHIDTIDTLQLLADNACLEAKSEGRNRVKLSNPKEHNAAEHRENSRWMQRIQQALSTDGFTLCVQQIKPVVSTIAGRDVYEVLIRMRSTEPGKLIAPGAFLPYAERYNLCVDIDLWVIKNIIHTAQKQLQESGKSASYWINLSGQSVSDAKFSDDAVELLQQAQLPDGTINFEITETEVIRDMTTAVALIERLKQFGCLFALDDFGSGLASFGYLKKLPIDIIKIDGMFIREINDGDLDRAFTKSIIDVAHAIGIETVAEFVENDAISAAVTQLGVDYLQGYGIHMPEELSLKFDTLEKRASNN